MWEGPWSDGSKEWNKDVQEELGHQFGNDSVFWITYEDMLEKYQHFDRTRLFRESNWRCCQRWIGVEVPWKAQWNEKFHFKLTKESPLVLVLQQLDERYYKGLQGQYMFRMHFRVHEQGRPESEDYIVRSHGNYLMDRSVSIEIPCMEPGNYSIFISVVAERNTTKSSIEEVVKRECRNRVENEKLAQVGYAYDLAHSKGVAHLEQVAKLRKKSDQKKASGSRQKERRHMWEKRHLNRDITKKQTKKNQEKRDKKREAREAKAKVEAEKVAAEAAKKKQEEAEAAEKKKQEENAEAKKKEAEEAERKKKEEAEEAERKEKEEEKPKDAGVQTDERQTGEDKSSQTEEATKPKDDANAESPDKPKDSSSDDTSKDTPADIQKANSEDKTVESTKDDSKPNEKEKSEEKAAEEKPAKEKPSEEKADSSVDAPPAKVGGGGKQEQTKKAPAPQPAYSSDGDSSDSPVEDWELLYSSDDMSKKPRMATAPATTTTNNDNTVESDGESSMPDPWNAICIVGFRVYSKDLDLDLRVVLEGGDMAENGMGEKGAADIDNAQMNAGGERAKQNKDVTDEVEIVHGEIVHKRKIVIPDDDENKDKEDEDKKDEEKKEDEAKDEGKNEADEKTTDEDDKPADGKETDKAKEEKKGEDEGEADGDKDDCAKSDTSDSTDDGTPIPTPDSDSVDCNPQYSEKKSST